MNCLCLYNKTQTYTNTVFEHLSSLHKYSSNCYWFSHHDENQELNIDLGRFDAVIVHYSVRLPYDQISESARQCLSSYKGLKVLFIQDEYNNTFRAWEWISLINFDLVFTVVPSESVHLVYPPEKFPNTQFVSCLTGYVPESLTGVEYVKPSLREIVVGYRGRSLPIEYGQLGIEKVEIGKRVRGYCQENFIKCDIEWTEEARIYGPDWYQFMASCRSMLGSESGSNVFDWDGTLAQKIVRFQNANPGASDEVAYNSVVKALELPGLMNQISPRIFEAIALKTVLVLFEGNYSGVLVPDRHYISLKKDFSNFQDVFLKLNDSAYVDVMADVAYEDIIASGRFSYCSFVKLVDAAISGVVTTKVISRPVGQASGFFFLGEPCAITTSPIRAFPPKVYGWRDQPRLFAEYIWWRLPGVLRSFLKPRLKRLFKRAS